MTSTLLLSLLLAQAPSREDLGRALVKWDDAKCAAFLASRGFVPASKIEVVPDDAASCAGESGGDRVELIIQRVPSPERAKVLSQLFHDSVTVGFVKRVYEPAAFVEVRQLQKKGAVELRDACVSAKKFDARACLEKRGWLVADTCETSATVDHCVAHKAQKIGTSAASISIRRDWAGAPRKTFVHGVAHWSRGPLDVEVYVLDYDASSAWSDALEKAAIP